MKNNKNKLISLKDMFDNNEDFKEALDDALILEKIKNVSKYSFEVEDLEEKLSKLIPQKKKLAFDILFANYKRYLYKHILELEHN